MSPTSPRPSTAPCGVVVSLEVAPEVDESWARDLALARVSLFDRGGRARIADRRLRIEAQRADLTDHQIARWAHALAELLHRAGALASRDAAIEIDDSRAR